MNQINFVGRLTEDPQIVYRAGNEPVCHAVFNFAVPDTCMKRDEQGNYPTDFFRCSCWNKLAEIVEKHCKKGTKLLITGRCKNNNYEKDGQRIYGTEILIDSLEFLESKKVKSECSTDKSPCTESTENTDTSLQQPACSG